MAQLLFSSQAKKRKVPLRHTNTVCKRDSATAVSRIRRRRLASFAGDWPGESERHQRAKLINYVTARGARLYEAVLSAAAAVLLCK